MEAWLLPHCRKSGCIAIVDDEKVVRQAVRTLIDWPGIGCEVVGEAIDGLECLELLARIPVDIVFTDIRMPHMDGIELIRRCAILHSSVRFVVLSAFDEFSLVRSAYAHGARDYILKSEISRSHVAGVIAVLKAEIREDRKRKRGESAPSDGNRLLEKNLLLQRLLWSDREDAARSLARLQAHGMSLAATSAVRIMIVRLRQPPHGEQAPPEDVRRFEVLAGLEDALGPAGAASVFSRHPSEYLFLLPDQGRVDDPLSTPRQVFATAAVLLERQGMSAIHAGLSGAGELDEATCLYEEAAGAADRFFLFGERKVYEPDPNRGAARLRHEYVRDRAETLRGALASSSGFDPVALFGALMIPAADITLADIPVTRALFQRYLFLLREYTEEIEDTAGLESALAGLQSSIEGSLAAGLE